MNNLGRDIHHPIIISEETESSGQQQRRRYGRITKARADLLQAPDRYIYFLDMPGLHRRHVQVKVEKNILYIRGKRNSSRIRGTEVISMERSTEYNRKFNLPWDFNIANIRADYKNGVLTVTVGRRQISTNERPRSVTIPVT